MSFVEFIINYWKYIVSGLVSACFLVVNIIQAIRSHDMSKLNEALYRIPAIIRDVEIIFDKTNNNAPLPLLSSVKDTDIWSISKKATAESILINTFGEDFVKKHIKVFDDAIEDILNTPQKKGGSNDGISKENEER